jgi:hypothetical protein
MPVSKRPFPELPVSGTTTRYAYDGDQIIAEYDNANNLVRKFIYGPGIDEPICMVVGPGATGTRYYYHYGKDTWEQNQIFANDQ